MLQTKAVQKIITKILCSVNVFSGNHAIYETMLKHRIEQCMPPMTIWCMLDNYGYRNTHRICNTYCFSTATMV